MRLDSVTLKRGVRVFVYAFLGTYGIPAILGAAAGSQPVNMNALRAAAVSGIAAVVALIWNGVMDPSRVPSLQAERTKS